MRPGPTRRRRFPAVGFAPLLLWGVACSAAYQAQPLDETDGGVFADASVQDASTGTDGSTPPRTDGGGTMDGGAPVVDRCSGVTCKENARCDGATGGCRCIPGFTADGSGACIAPAPGTPLSHSQADVCGRWRADHAAPAGPGWTAGATTCDPGTLTRGALDDAVVRINLFRWLVGLAPAVDDPASFTTAMQCATVAAWNPPGTVPNPHAPPSSAKCYTAGGAAGAGSSNIAWGSGSAANAMDQWVQDNGNDTTFGHRRWILNPPLGRTAIGYYGGGGPYGSASCMSSFDGSGSGPSPDWISFPPQGFAPTEIVGWGWTVHLKAGDPTPGTLTVTRASDGAALKMTKLPLQAGFGSYGAVAFRPDGWQAAGGEIYRATFTGAGPTLAWDVKAVDCP